MSSPTNPAARRRNPRAAAPGRPNVQFIVATSTQKADPETRRLIRSHVMRGRNRGRPGRSNVPDPSSTDIDAPSHSPRDDQPDGARTGGSESTLVGICQSMIPPRVGTDISLTRFADDIAPSSFGDILKFSFIAKKVLFPLQPCVDFEKQHGSWFEPLTTDAAYLHAMAFSSQAYFGLAMGNKDRNFPGGETSQHFVRTVQLLRERLLALGPGEQVSDLTISVVLSLATYAYLTGDDASAAHHMDGLRQIADLRGGLSAFLANDKLLIEMLRCDIALVLHRGGEPKLAYDGISQGSTAVCRQKLLPLLPTPPLVGAPPRSELESFLDDVDGALADAWQTLKTLCLAVESALESKSKLPKSVLLHPMASVMYPLLGMRFEPGTLDETVRLGILGFASRIFLQWRGVRPKYAHFAAAFRDSITRPKSLEGFSPQLLVWLLVVGAMSAAADDDRDMWFPPLLQAHLMLCEIDSWDDLRHMLKEFLWISVVQDPPGKEIYDRVVL
ncbi:hypothetical protein VTK73DRAFT_9792 [Phialemonium thermophilum]|uniref:Uncharacterized protein n=1 Tax=Phialemonium thermophilum TaxID=223376 RepID=A0ABR3W0A0_9PEZI